jgi:hypothetical protein
MDEETSSNNCLLVHIDIAVERIVDSRNILYKVKSYYTGRRRVAEFVSETPVSIVDGKYPDAGFRVLFGSCQSWCRPRYFANNFRIPK